MSVNEYLELIKTNKEVLLSPAGRLLKAIGEPELVDTSKDPRLSRIFSNRIIKRYAVFDDFFGIEEAIERIVDFLKHSEQGLEESKQVLYLLGAVGTAKSSLADRLKQLMEKEPFYTVAFIDAKGRVVQSPVLDHPLSLFASIDAKNALKKQFGVLDQHFRVPPSGWLIKRIQEVEGDLTRFKVLKLHPSNHLQRAIGRTEAGDENTQDVSILVGKMDIRKLELFAQNDPDSYLYSGMLCKANQGIGEFVEMFKASLPVLNPLLTATQEHKYQGTEPIGELPFDGVILAHSNESEWQKFKNSKTNEAILDRIYLVKVPYNLRPTEEVQIYRKLLNNSLLKDSPVAPRTLKMLADFCVQSRMINNEHVNTMTKLRVYDGENVKEKDARAKPLLEYKQMAGLDEGMDGLGTRFAFKVLSKTFNYDLTEVAANPVHLLHVLDKHVKAEQFSKDKEASLLSFIESELKPQYTEFLTKEIQTAYIESYSEYGQNAFDQYIKLAELWLADEDFVNHDTGTIMNRLAIDKELDKIERPAGIINHKDFRQEVVTFCLRHRASNSNQNPKWTAYEKLKEVIEKKLFNSAEDLLPVISFGAKKSEDDAKKHKAFVDRMVDLGYTEKQVRLLVEYYQRVRRSE